jgi:hypothetical protein
MFTNQRIFSFNKKILFIFLIEFNDVYIGDGAYGSTIGDISYDAPPEQIVNEPEKSEYEASIIDAYNNLQSKMNFAEYVGNDQWCIIHLPKSARSEQKSRIRKMLPGGRDDKSNAKSSGGKTTQKSSFFTRIRTGVGTLVNDENNLIFGKQANYEMVYYDDDYEDDVDTDDLHRYTQKLRELEDTDREVNPEFLVLRDGKTVYGVHEADADGKMTFSTRKPIYDRFGDQALDDEPTEKRKLLSRLNPFNRNKAKDNSASNSPKSARGTPDSIRKRSNKKAANKITEDDMATMANSEPLVD